ncbi:XAP5-domain-containing protein [Basidiobolus meristosporus CBS 931.73]|uniref:XAP5-domain-containing protein n=1 Tax=Basidiobolus meristosporus CBS 931.73 TaxID=1314790 RepID=A0A1Y1XIF4_9FUNG|nr:XAP5-domain-containing protein [Basidiobolus meristosporus CBS 931.73]ORX85146.1 XAP5-domain-containing protein [Basidiobolus meristosporus CBS 931.73]|eukprot:ORX82842.1 XAP5-domain-containing protein [Basidiobolus meristosporus CBS 931.73]
MAEYKGGNSEGLRQAMLEKQRQKMLDDFEKKREQITKDSKVRIGSDKFVSQHDSTETMLKKSTIGLVQLEDFQRIRSEIELRRAQEAAKTLVKDDDKKKRKKKKKETSRLSFALEEEGEMEGEEVEAKEIKKVKLGKNPDVDTSFLPDRDREAEEKRQREELRVEWLKKQEIIKDQDIEITWSYWDGRGHRKSTKCKKGDTISTFLIKCREQIPDIRGVHVDNLMYIKEDLIIQHHYTFYDFIINKVRGKSGPLFSFDVKEDIRLVNDAAVEKEESHAGKVVERAWYERNKHIFPASRWEPYDPEKDYGKYSIKDKRESTEPTM